MRFPEPVIFFEQKSVYSFKGEVPDGELVEALGKAKVLRAKLSALAAVSTGVGTEALAHG